jgi:hypothetical protein
MDSSATETQQQFKDKLVHENRQQSLRISELESELKDARCVLVQPSTVFRVAIFVFELSMSLRMLTGVANRACKQQKMY